MTKVKVLDETSTLGTLAWRKRSDGVVEREMDELACSRATQNENDGDLVVIKYSGDGIRIRDGRHC